MPLDQVKDEMFRSEALGKTIAIIPSKGELHAPADGTVSALYPSKHAVGMVLKNGTEVLFHVGINTVELDGKFFESFTEQGAEVRQGDLLLKFNLDEIKKAGYDTTTFIVFTNGTEHEISNITKNTDVKTTDVLLTVK